MWRDVPQVTVNYRLMSGDLKAQRKLPVSATGRELFVAVGDIICPLTSRLLVGDLPVWFNSREQALLDAGEEPVEVTVVHVTGDFFEFEHCSFIDLIKRNRMDLAELRLRSHPEVEELVSARSGGDTALCWAAYKAGDDHIGFELLKLILSVRPSDAQVRSSMHGFLPLHEAAWGGASPAIAVLLCSAYPEAVFARDNCGCVAHEVGQYYNRRFRWPVAEELLRCAAELRRRLCAKYPDFQHGLAQHMDLRGECEALLRSVPPPGIVPAAVDVVDQPRRAEVRIDVEMAHPRLSAAMHFLPTRRASRPALSRECEDHEGVRVARESVAKDAGRLAGLRSVRNRRCSFKEWSTIFVSGEKLQLRRHVVRTVAKDCQRSPLEAKWPSKAQLRRDRAYDRAWKQVDDLMEVAC